MSKLTGTHSEASEIDFTTLTTVPGTVKVHGAPIQILDLREYSHYTPTESLGVRRSHAAFWITFDWPPILERPEGLLVLCVQEQVSMTLLLRAFCVVSSMSNGVLTPL